MEDPTFLFKQFKTEKTKEILGKYSLNKIIHFRWFLNKELSSIYQMPGRVKGDIHTASSKHSVNRNIIGNSQEEGYQNKNL